jgi:hypothetical protein
MRAILIFFLALSVNILVAQKSIWATLGIVTSTKSYNQEFGFETTKVKVSPVVRSLEGKEIEIDGFIIPLTGKLAQNHFMLSKFSEKMCFFCGKAGPETAMQVFLKENKKQKYTEEKIKVKGILRINENDSSGLLYTLDLAEVIN